MKKIALLLILFITHNISATDFAPIVLEAEILDFVDGSPIGIDENKVGSIMRLRLDIIKCRLGRSVNGIMVGNYIFEDKKYTLAELIELEDQLMRSNSSADQRRLKELRKYLESMKEEFIELITPLLLDARGAKSQMVILISEWSHKARRQASLLLDWATTKEGEETNSNNSVYRKILNMKDFDMFCQDLTYFLETLLRSCPKACAKFKIMMEQKQKEQQKPH